jgi:exopolyphosphatase/guanosine-5'-triphosphate,3'-diphosphate pyrophosphatase
VTRLAALLRVADSLDREHLQKVSGVTVKIREHEVALWVEGTAGALLESWTLRKKASLFAKIFDHGVTLRYLGEERAAEGH